MDVYQIWNTNDTVYRRDGIYQKCGSIIVYYCRLKSLFVKAVNRHMAIPGSYDSAISGMKQGVPICFGCGNNETKVTNRIEKTRFLTDYVEGS